MSMFRMWKIIVLWKVARKTKKKLICIEPVDISFEVSIFVCKFKLCEV
jgi:hypothetical protein